MKTNTFKYFGLALMAILMVSFTSCEVEIDSFYDDDNNGAGYYNRSADLCSRTWVSFYRDMDGNYCRQELDFFLDRTGIDYIRVEYPNGTVEQYEYNFRWNWRIMRRLPFVCHTDRMMFHTWMMCTSVETG